MWVNMGKTSEPVCGPVLPLKTNANLHMFKIWVIFHITVLTNRRLDHPMADAHNTYICPYKHAEI